MISNPPLFFLSQQYVSNQPLVFLFLLVPKSLLCCSHFGPALECVLSSSIYTASLPHSAVSCKLGMHIWHVIGIGQYWHDNYLSDNGGLADIITDEIIVSAMFQMFPMDRCYVYLLCHLWNWPNLPWLLVLLWLSQGAHHSVLNRIHLTCFVEKQLS